MQNFIPTFEQLKELNNKMQESQYQISQVQATAEAGAGLVKATVNGHKNLIKIEIDPTIIQPDEQKMLQDLIIAATNLAIQKVEVKVKEVVRKNAADAGIPLDLFL